MHTWSVVGLGLLILSDVTSRAIAQSLDVSGQGITILSDVMTGDVNQSMLSATGNVQISRGDFVLQADQARYDIEDAVISASGNVQLRGLRSVTISAERIQTTTDLARVFASDVSLSFGQGILKARRAVTTSRGDILLERVVATACPTCSSNRWPLWSINARSTRRDAQAKRVRFTHAVLRVNGLPIVYIPGISFPSPEVVRASGFLPPRLGNSQVGPTIELPYHLLLSRDQDVTVSAKLTGSSPISTIDYRGHFDRARIAFKGGLTYDQQPENKMPGMTEGTWRGHFRGSAALGLGRHWRLGTVFERQSDPAYDLRYAIERSQKAADRLYLGQPRTLLSQVYLTGVGNAYDFEASAFFFQDISASPVKPAEPQVIPFFRTRRQFGLGKLGKAQLDGLIFADPNPTTDTSPNVYATTRLSWIHPTGIGPGMILTPHLSARVDRDWQENATTTLTQARFGASLAWPLAVVGKSKMLIEPHAWISADLNSGSTTRLPFWARTPGISGIDAPVYAGVLTDPPVGYAGVDSRISLGAAQLSLSADRRWFAEANQDSTFAIRLSRAGNFAAARVIFDDTLALRETDLGVSFTYGDMTGQMTWFISNRSNRQGGRIRLAYRLDENWSLIYTRQSNVAESFDILEIAEVVFDGACTEFTLSLRRSELTFDSIMPNTTLGFSLAFKIPS